MDDDLLEDRPTTPGLTPRTVGDGRNEDNGSHVESEAEKAVLDAVLQRNSPGLQAEERDEGDLGANSEKSGYAAFEQ